MNIIKSSILFIIAITLTACGGGGDKTETPSTSNTLGAIQIKTISTTLGYDEALATSSNTSIKIAGEAPLTNPVVFNDSPDNSNITIDADLSTETVGESFTVVFTANIEDAKENTNVTMIKAVINP